MNKFAQIFQVKKAVIAMVHLQYMPGMSKQQYIDAALRDVKTLGEGGVHGLMFENWGMDYSWIRVRQDELEYIDAAMDAAKRGTKLPYGVNILPFDHFSDRYLADRHGAEFVQIDTLVDDVVTDYSNEFIMRPTPDAIRSHLAGYVLLANIQTKHYRTLPPNKKLETSARQAVQHGADALVVTGKLTGKETPISKILRARKAVNNGIPIGIGSGMNVNNVPVLMPHADFCIVGTGIKKDKITENPYDPDETRRFMDTVCKLF